MNNSDLFEAMKTQHEYTLMEVRLSAEDVKTTMRNEFGPRIVSLEHYRTCFHGIIIGLGLAWGLVKAWTEYFKVKIGL